MIKIFICHKKRISTNSADKESNTQNIKADVLFMILKEKYSPWIDKEISTGMKWETKIYEELLKSDVLLVAIGPNTSQSEWVKREIALATALGISIFPLGYDLTNEEFGDELKRLGIDQFQGHLTQNLDLFKKDALILEINDALEASAEETIKRQKNVLSPLLSKKSAISPKASDNQKAFSVKAKIAGSTLNFHIASGDLTRTRGIDVLVNSENDYMQMARFFESRTVSSLIRSRGTRVNKGKYIDAIQQELDMQLGLRSRPVLAGETFVTSAGIPDSQLATDNKTRYIFHVAAVQAVDAQAKVVPFQQPHQIEKCIRSCFLELKQLNEKNGVVSPINTEQVKIQKELASANKGKVNSILFPLFGTGQGGAVASDSISHMLSGILHFFSDSDNSVLASELTDVYFAAYRESDKDDVHKALVKTFIP